jgi:hypothetical protein
MLTKIYIRNKSKKNKEKEREDRQEDSKKKRKLTPMSVLGKHTSLPIPLTEFPNLVVIDKFMTEALAHPHIPILEL